MRIINLCCYSATGAAHCCTGAAGCRSDSFRLPDVKYTTFKLSSDLLFADDHNRVRPNMHTSQPTLPRSNRQYVPPLMLARGRGKKLSELHTSKTKVLQATGEIVLGCLMVCFSNENMESYLEHVLDHMKELWIHWRSDLLRYNVKNKNITLQVVYNQKPPNGLDKNDWRWLIKEVYSTDKFKKVSARNSTNRLHYQKELSHRTGSKPFRQVIWKDLGANKGIKPDLVNVFYTTCKNGNSLPMLRRHKNMMKFEKYWKKIRHFPMLREELEVELNTTKKQNQVLESRVEALQVENNDLKGRVGSVEAQMKRFEDMMMNQLNVNPSSS
ncbi:Autophagy-related protein 11, partial [Bienertia sinuspersici]